jgi:hypothetical protein
MKPWKAKAVSTFALIPSVEPLRGRCAPQVFSIWEKFVTATRLATKSRITRAEITTIREIYIQVVQEYEEVFIRPGEADARSRVKLAHMCVHMLAHIAHQIELWGPLIGYSQYTCERLIGQIKPWIRSYRFPSMNLAFIILRLQIQFILEFQDPAPPLPPLRRSIRHPIPHTRSFLRHRREKFPGPLSDRERAMLPQDEDWQTATIQRWARLELNHELVCGSVWGELKRDKKELRRKCRVRVRTSTGFSFYIRAQSSCR